ncbi:MAG: hypothetical protein QM784_32770 [Polyangiaceae bacterium]
METSLTADSTVLAGLRTPEIGEAQPKARGIANARDRSGPHQGARDGFARRRGGFGPTGIDFERAMTSLFQAATSPESRRDGARVEDTGSRTKANATVGATIPA